MSPIGLYQSNLTVLNQTSAASTGNTYNGPSFSAANLNGGIATLVTGAASGGTPTATLTLQSSADGGATWQAVTAVTGSLTDVTGITVTAGSATNKTFGGTYIGNLLRFSVAVGGTGQYASLVLKLDAQKRFADNA